MINQKSNQFITLRFKEEIVPSLTLFPVCLPPPIENDSVTDYTGQEVFVTGYGCTDEKCGFGDLSQQLQEISIEVISNDLAMCWFLNNSRVDAGSQEYVPKQLFVTGGFLNGDPTTCQVWFNFHYFFFLRAIFHLLEQNYFREIADRLLSEKFLLQTKE